MTDDLSAATPTVLQATSSRAGPRGRTSIVLSWVADPGYDGFNLYRRDPGTPRAAGDMPINSASPIRQVSTCDELRAIVPEKSDEWGILANAFTTIATRADPAALPVSPCDAFDRGLTAAEQELFDQIAQGRLVLRLARGLGFVDESVAAGQEAAYELAGVTAGGKEVTLVEDVRILAGFFVPPDPPSGLVASVGDRRVLTLWNRNPFADSYAVQRSTNPGGPFLGVNPQPVRFDIDSDLDNQPVLPDHPGFLDIQQWDPDGLPSSHLVDGLPIVGPDNGTTYYYRVASRDIFGRVGAWTTAVAATPMRSVPPMAPDLVQLRPDVAATSLELSWRKVTRDVDGHQLLDTTGNYAIFRSANQSDLEDLTALPGLQVATVAANPSDPTTATLRWIDTDPILIPPFGETTFYYRLTCSDPVGNVGAPSAIVAAAVPDTRPPGRTEPDGADGAPDHITVYWRPNTEPDLAGYQIYRGVCDRGEMYVPGRTRGPNDKNYEPGRTDDVPRGKCDMTLVGQVPLADAEVMLKATGRIHFDDFTVPEGSPLCYGYWVRAYDHAQNLYGGADGCPVDRNDYVCMRLIEKTPPPAPIVTSLRARSDAVLVEWIASPIQDLRAFHVYRSDRESDPPTFLARINLDGTVSPTPWPGVVPSCVDIPAEPDPLTARGSYLDATAVPQEIYWYRVSALDWLGNESEGADLLRLPSSSTFAFTHERPVEPVILVPSAPPAAGCGLEVRWDPPYDPAALEGFVVFRSGGGGPYRQVSAILPDNAFTDPTARRGVRYLYRVQSVDRKGRLSSPSPAVLHPF
jgi:hypothetical protein